MLLVGILSVTKDNSLILTSDVLNELELVTSMNQKYLYIVKVVILCQVLNKRVVLQVSTCVLLPVENGTPKFGLIFRLNAISDRRGNLIQEEGREQNIDKMRFLDNPEGLD